MIRMATEDYRRKLTAILSADVKGYSRLMGANDAAAIPLEAGDVLVVSAEAGVLDAFEIAVSG
jgi:class 3 adenylate cyclase